MVWNFISKITGQKKKTVRRKVKRKTAKTTRVKSRKIKRNKVVKKTRRKTVKKTKQKNNINIKKQLAKLNKEVDAFSKATHKFLGSALNYAALHPNGIKRIEKHVLFAAHNLEQLRKINKK